MRNCPASAVFWVMVAGAIGAGAKADSIRLHDQAGAPGPMVTLSEVGELEGPYARSLADTVVGAFREGAGQLNLSLGAVSDALARRDVHWGRLSLQGHETCQVFRTGREDAPRPADRSPAIANLETDIGLHSAMSVRDRIVRQIEQVTGRDRADLRVRFKSEEARLNQAAGDQLVIEAQNREKYGRLSFLVHPRGPTAADQRFTVRVEVARRALVLVATRAVPRGQMLSRDAVEVKSLWLEDNGDEPLQKPAVVNGQIAAKPIRAGSVIFPHHIRAPLLVRRGDLITVNCYSGGLLIRTAAWAREDGAFGDVIVAQNEKTREKYAVTIAGHRTATIHLDQVPDSGDDT